MEGHGADDAGSRASLGWDLRLAGTAVVLLLPQAFPCEAVASQSSLGGGSSQALHFPRKPLSGVSAPRVSAGLRGASPRCAARFPCMDGWMGAVSRDGTHQQSIPPGGFCSWDTQGVLQLQPPEPADGKGRVQCIRAQHQGKHLRPFGVGMPLISSPQPSGVCSCSQIGSVAAAGTEMQRQCAGRGGF